MKNNFWVFLLLLFSTFLHAQEIDSIKNPLVAKDSLKQKQWVDSIYNEMSLKKKVGQLFMVDVFSNKSKQETNYVKTLIRDYHIGGIIFSKGGPVRQAKLNNDYQEASEVPLLMGMDAEWGLAMRLDSTYAFPWNMTLGAVENKELIELTGAQIAKHMRRMGMQIDFAPDIDININPNNPIIGNRAFGENKIRVAEHGIAFMKGMEGGGILTSAKHFPGHGDTDVDSHKALPVLNFSKERLDSVELYPFKKIIPEGVSSILVGHLEVPSLDNRKNKPASLSKPIVTGLLKNKLNFKGLIITDGMNMKGVTDTNFPGKADLDAFLAGNDIILIPQSAPKGIEKIVQAYENDKISDERLEHSVKKILMAKYKVRLNNYKPVKKANLVKDLNSDNNDLLYAKLMEHAITVIKNDKAILPIRDLDKKRIAYVPMGNGSGNKFYKTLNKYGKVDKIEASRLNDLIEKLKPYNQVIIGFHKSNANPWVTYKFTDKELVWLHEISRQKSTILNVFTRPYALLDLRSTTNLEGIAIGYQNSKIAQEKTAQVLFGAIGAKGKLPVSLGSQFPEGTQLKTRPLKRLSYGVPESVGMSSKKLRKIDAIAEKAISEKMTPGMQILVARKGRVVFQKNYGYHTYGKKKRVKDNDLFDLASITKILGTLPLLVELEGKGVLRLDMQLQEMMPFLRNSNKANISLKETLSHYGRFPAWIPFYKFTLDAKGKPSPKYYRFQNSDPFNVKIADHLFMNKNYQDSIYNAIIDSKLRIKKEYKYSDLPYYLFKRYLEDYYNQDINTLSRQHFFAPLGANYLGYQPLKRFKPDNIVPSEKDDYWRMQEIHGYVNDQGAAMFGGLGGHAGLFSNANDVAKMMQMFLNGGYYGGRDYFNPKTVNKFNTCNYCDKNVRRGVGFDKPQFPNNPGPTSKYASKNSFGHAGFTGTVAWADPDEELVYVLLSNRTYPDPSNRKFISKNIRTDIYDLIYESIKDSKIERRK